MPNANEELCRALGIAHKQQFWVAHLGTPNCYTSVFGDTPTELDAAIAIEREKATNMFGVNLRAEFHRYLLIEYPNLDAPDGSGIVPIVEGMRKLGYCYLFARYKETEGAQFFPVGRIPSSSVLGDTLPLAVFRAACAALGIPLDEEVSRG